MKKRQRPITKKRTESNNEALLCGHMVHLSWQNETWNFGQQQRQ